MAPLTIVVVFKLVNVGGVNATRLAVKSRPMIRDVLFLFHNFWGGGFIIFQIRHFILQTPMSGALFTGWAWKVLVAKKARCGRDFR